MTQTINTVEDVRAEMETSEKRLRELRNLMKETESNIFAEGAYIRYLRYRLKELEKKNQTIPY